MSCLFFLLSLQKGWTTYGVSTTSGMGSLGVWHVVDWEGAESTIANRVGNRK